MITIKGGKDIEMLIYSKPQLKSLEISTQTRPQCKKKYCKKKYKTNTGHTCNEKYCSASYCKSYCKGVYG